MTTPPFQVERRVGQRFSYLLPVSLRQIDDLIEGVGFTQDLSSCGVFFLTDARLREGAAIELTLRMPSEITLGDSMPVRCRGRILRIVRPALALFPASPCETPAETKIGVAVRLEGYEYLPESAELSPCFERVSALHSHPEEDADPERARARSAVG